MNKIVLVLFVIISLFATTASGENFSDNPNWIDGTLLVTMRGDRMMNLNALTMGRYVCIYDFNQDTCTTTGVPDHSTLSKDLSDAGRPVIIYESPNWYNGENGNRWYKWREISVSAFEDDPNSVLYKTFNSEYFDFNSLLGENMHFDAPMALLQIHSPQYCVYYLRYAVSDEQELEIELVRETETETIVYSHFPMDYDFGHWYHSISKDGRIAWGEPVEKHFYVSDGESVFSLPETELTRSICWLDNRTLLYFNCAMKPPVLTAWDTVLSEKTILTDIDGRPIVHEDDSCIVQMCVDGSGQFLAYYTAPIGHQSGKNSITILSLESGASYCLDPWPESFQIQKADRAYAESTRYTISDDGIYLFEPAEEAELQIVWMD